MKLRLRALLAAGGPAFHNSFSDADASCRYTLNYTYLGGYQRVDIESIQTWLATFEGLGDLD